MSESQIYRILVLDDEEDVTELLAFHLRAKGFEVLTLNDPNAIFGHIREFQPHLFILDVMMPDLSGVQVCRLLRADSQFKDAPIIFLTARAEEGDRIQGFEIGADDYICKPFSPRELVLRVQSVLRRRLTPQAAQGETVRAGDITIDLDRHEVRVGSNTVVFTATEFRLLSLLVQRKGRVQSREQLLTNVWNYDQEMETRTVDTHIRRIREKLGDAGSVIETIRGVGYRVTEK
jgi:two-component system, OmpR family, phosphate regulon response regulator PhoB